MMSGNSKFVSLDEKAPQDWSELQQQNAAVETETGYQCSPC